MNRKRLAGVASPVHDDGVRDALSRLVSALVSPTAGQTRLALVETAVAHATLALGATAVDIEALNKALETLATEVVVDKMERDGLFVYHVSVEAGDEEQATIVATTSPVLASAFDGVLQTHVTADLSIN